MVIASLALVGLTFFVPRAAADPLTSLEYTVTGQQLQVTPASLAVPKGIPGSFLATVLAGGEPANPEGTFVEATLRGPSFPARRIVGPPGEPILLPPLTLVGDYSLDDIRLVDSTTNATILVGSPSRIPITVFDEVLIARVTSRPLNSEEIQQRGIVIDENNFRAVEFEVGFVVDGKTIPVKFPVVAPAFYGNTELIPTAEIEERLAEAELINEQLTVGLPPELEASGLQIEVKGLNVQFVDPGGDQDLELSIPPIAGLVVIPGKIGFLNQFFAVQVFVENAAPTGSGLSVTDITAELVLPAGDDRVPASSYEEPGDDPLRFARVGPDAIIRNVLPVRRAGADGVFGTADDAPRLQPRQVGQCEFLVEGLREGLHVMDVLLKGTLEGLVAGAVEVEGRAAGSILVRNPNFSLAFSHPRTIRTGEPYTASVTILNTSSTPANQVTVTLPEASVSGARLTSDATVALGDILPGQTATAEYRLVAQRTGSITFSNFTSDDDVVGRFRLRMGVDERGVPLSPDSIGYPEFVDELPTDLFAAADRVLGQALSVATAGQLPPGVQDIPNDGAFVTSLTGRPLYRLPPRIVQKRIVELAEAGQRLRYGDSLERVLADLLLDWQGAREYNSGFDQILKVTDAGRQWRETIGNLMGLEQPGLSAPERLADRAADLAGRGERWWAASSGSPDLEVGFVGAGGAIVAYGFSDLDGGGGYRSADGGTVFLPPQSEGRFEWRTKEAAATGLSVSVLMFGEDGTGTLVEWNGLTLPAGGVAAYAPSAGDFLLQIDADGDGTFEGSLAGSSSPVQELDPEVIGAIQDVEVFAGRPRFQRCTPTPVDINGKPHNNYGTIVGVLFSKPMAQGSVEMPGAYVLDNGNKAVSVAIQPGGRVAIINLQSGIGLTRKRDPVSGETMLRQRDLSVTGVSDPRGGVLANATLPIGLTADQGVAISGRVVRADGSPAANVPVTLTYYEQAGLFCALVKVRPTQVRTDANGRFSLDFVMAGVPYSLSATDTLGLSDEVISIILQGSGDDEVIRGKLLELASQPNVQGTLLEQFAVGGIADAIALVEALDRALLKDLIDIGSGRTGSETPVALRFRGRATVQGTVFAADGVTPVRDVAVNLFPDPSSREKGRGVLTGSDGRFEFFGVPLGTFSLQARAPNGTARALSETLTEVGEVREVPVVLSASMVETTGVRGFVYEADGVTPHVGATVLVGEFRDNTVDLTLENVVAIASTDVNGFYSAGRVPVGSHDLVALSVDGKRRGIRLDAGFTAGTTTVVNLSLQARAIVRGRVEFADGTAAGNAIVAGGLALVRTDAGGNFVLDGVPTGRRAISAGLERNEAAGIKFPRIGSTQLEVVPGDNNFAIIRFSPRGSITGRVLTAAGDPVAGLNVALPLDASAFAYTPTDANGVYLFENIELKEWTVSAPAPAASNSAQIIGDALDTIGGAASGEQVSQADLLAAVTDAYSVFTGINDPLINGDGLAFNPISWGYQKVKLTFDGQVANADVVFLPEGTVSGKVINGQGSPAGARVRLTGIGPTRTGDLGFIIRGERDSDPATGAFSFPGQALAGAFGLQAASPFFNVVVSYNDATTRVAPDATGIILQFPPDEETKGRLVGSVFRPDGSPVGADVDVRISFGDNFIVRTRADGTFDTQIDLPAGGYSVEAEDPGTGLRGRSYVTVRAGIVNEVSVTLLDKGDLGILVTEADGTPVPGANVMVRKGGFPSEDFDLVTGGDGSVLLGNVFEGSYSVSASAIFGPTTIRGSRGATVVAGQTTQVTVVLQPTGTIRGTFVEDDGVTPVAFAQIVIGSGTGFATTGADGRFEVTGLPLGSYRLIATEPVSGRLGVANAALNFDGQVLDLLIRVRSLGEVRGGVLNSARSGYVSGAVVTLNPSDGLTPARQVTTGPDGRFSFPGTVEGAFTLSALDPPSGVRGSVGGRLDPGVQVLEIDVPLQALGEITLTVLEPDGATPANATVTLSGGGKLLNGDTDAGGAVTFGDLPLASYTVTARSMDPGKLRSGTRVSLGISQAGVNAPVNVVLGGVGRIEGSVVQSDGLTPAGNATVSLSSSSTALGSESRNVVTGSDGTFAFDGVAVGTYQVTATSLALAASASGSIAVDGETDTLTLMLGDNGSVGGRLLRADGTTPVVGLEVAVLFDSQSGLLGVKTDVTDADGSFGMSGVPVGPFDFEALLPSVNGIARLSSSVTGNGELVDLGDVLLDEDDLRVESVSPVDGALDVSVVEAVRIVFNEPVDPGSFDAKGVYLCDEEGEVPATLSVVDDGSGVFRVIELLPNAALKSETTYNLVVLDGDRLGAGSGSVAARGPRDLVGRPMLVPFQSSFTTEDARPPELLSITPADGAIQVDPRGVVRLSFDETLAPGGIVILLSGPDGFVAGSTSLGVNGQAAVFTPAADLKPNASYTAMASGFEDLAGNVAVGQPYTSTFTTLDTLGPDIAEIRIKDGAQPVANAAVELEVVLQTPEPDARVRMTANLVAIGETTTPGDLDLPFTIPASGSVTIRAIAIDRFGNEGPLAETLITVLANQPPQITVTQVLPSSGPLPTGSPFQLRAEASDDAGVASFRAAVTGGAEIPLQSNNDGSPLFFSGIVRASAGPGSPVTVVAQATDSSGESTPELSFVFPVADGTKPTVAISNPPAGTEFASGEILELQVDARDNFGVTEVDYTLSGAVSLSGTFAVAAPQPGSKLLTIPLAIPGGTPLDGSPFTVEVVARDAAGLASAADRREFATPDERPPQLVEVRPADQATNQSLWQRVNLLFDEGMDASALGASNLTLVDGSSAPVPLAGIQLLPGADFTKVGLQNATATFSQTSSGGFPVGGAIDGSTASGSWAVFGSSANDSTGVFETAEDLDASATAGLRFRIHHDDPAASAGHNVGRFRLSYTTDDRDTFADGLANGGDVDANWTVVQVAHAESSEGDDFTILPDGSVLVSGGANSRPIYTISAGAVDAVITGFRIELLKHPSLPSGGPGRQSNGNLHLSELVVEAAGVPGGASLVPAAGLEPGEGYTIHVGPGIHDLAGNPWQEAGGTPVPPEGRDYTFTTAAVTSIEPAPATMFVVGQDVAVNLQYESGLGAGSFRLRLNDEAPVELPAGTTSTATTLSLSQSMTEARLNLAALRPGCPDYEFPEIVLDLRPRDEDTDMDGILNGDEVDNGLDPFFDDASDDPDGDNLSNLEEVGLGTDPHNPDTDGDGLRDDVDPDPLTPLGGAAPIAGTPATPGSYLAFDGINDGFQTGLIEDNGFGAAVTVEGWIRTTQQPPAGSPATIVSKWRGSITERYPFAVFIEESGVLRYQAGASSQPSVVLSGSSPVNDGEWHHFACVRDGTATIRIYVDGLEDAVLDDFNLDLSFDLASGSPHFGTLNGTQFYEGDLDEVRMWNRVRSQDELRRDARRLLSGFEAGLSAYFPFDEGGGEMVFDQSDNPVYGTLGDAPGQPPSWMPDDKGFFGPPVFMAGEGTDETLTLPGTDLDGTALSATITGLPTRGRLFQTADGVSRGVEILAADLPAPVSDPDRRVIYAPEPAGAGPVSMRYVISDSSEDSTEVTASIHVRPANSPPNASGDNLVVYADAPAEVDVLGNDSDAEADALSVGYFSQPEHGTVQRIGDRTLRYIPPDGYTGPDSFTYLAIDREAWNRASDYRQGTVNGSTVGNPTPAAFGFPAWQMEVIDHGSPFSAARPWYQNRGSKALWSSSWRSGSFVTSIWARAQSGFPRFFSGSFEIHTGRPNDGVPVVRWTCPFDNYEVDVIGELGVSWSGIVFEQSSDLEVAVAHFDASSGTVTDLALQTVTKPTADSSNESTRFPIEVRGLALDRGDTVFFTPHNEKNPAGFLYLGDSNVWIVPAHTANTAVVNLDVQANQRPVTTAFPSGSGLEFNGGFVTIPSAPELQITGDQTIEMWLKPYDFDQRRNPFAKAYGGAGTITQETDGRLNYFYGIVGSNGGAGGVEYTAINTTRALPLDVWTHVAVVRDLTNGKLRWYINGALTNEIDALFPSAVAGGNPVQIGAGYVQPYMGCIDEVRLWNVARSQAEIQAALHQRLTGGEAGLAGYWAFEEGSGTTAADSTTSGNDGTLVGTLPLWVASQAPFEGGVPTPEDTDLTLVLDGADGDGDSLSAAVTRLPDRGMLYQTADGITRGDAIVRKSGSALEFDGSDDVAFLPAEILDGASDLTIQWWARPTKDNYCIFSGARASQTNAFILCPRAGTSTMELWENNSAVASWLMPNVVDGNWHSFTFVRNQTEGFAELFVDGRTRGTRSLNLTTIDIDPGGFVVGQDQDTVGGGFQVNDAFAGELDEIRIWDRALEGDEIDATRGVVLDGDEAGLRALYRLDEETGSSIIDATSNGSDGSLGSGPASSLPRRVPSQAMEAAGLRIPVTDAQRRVIYAPDPDFSGVDLVGYVVNDRKVDSEEGITSIIVTPVNDAPVAVDDFGDVTVSGVPITTGSVLANDFDLEGDPIAVASFDATSAAGGTVADNGDGTFTYTPLAGFSGDDTFTYTLTDGMAEGNAATVTVTVAPLNTFMWNNGAGGNWGDASNWTPNGVPGVGDLAIIGLGGDYTVTVNVDTTVSVIEMGGSGGTQTLLLNGRTLTVDNQAVLGPTTLFRLANGNLRGAGTLFFDGAVLWTGGSILDGGRKVNRGNFTMDVDGTSLQLRNGCRFENEGTVVYQGGSSTGGGDLFLDQGSTFLNASGAVFDVRTVRDLRSGSGTRGVFTNEGEFRKDGGGSTFTHWDFLNAGGAVNVVSGRFEMTNGGASTGGTWAVPADTFLRCSGGTCTFDASSTVAGEGNFEVVGGTVNFDAPFGLTGPVTLSGGTWFQNSDATLVSPLTHSNGDLRGSGAVFFDAGVTWTGGSILDGGRKVNRSVFTMDVSGTNVLLRNGCRFENEATVVYQGGSSTGGGDLYMDQGSTFLNAVGAVFEVRTVRDLRSGSGVRGVFTNEGEFRKDGDGTTFTNWDFFNTGSGVVNVLSGRLELANGGASTGGTWNIPVDTFLRCSGGTCTFDAASTVAGAGSLEVVGGTVNFDAPFGLTGPVVLSGGTWFQNSDATLVSPLTLSNGTLRGSGSVFFDAGVTWTNGSILDSGRKVNRGTFTMDVGATNLLLRNGCRFENEGTVVLQGGSPTGGGDLYMDQESTFLNASGAVFEVQTVRDLRSGSGVRGVFTNEGEFRKDGDGTTFTNWDFFNTGSGVVNVLSGRFELANGGASTGGTWNIPVDTFLRCSGGTYTFDAASTVAGAGSFEVTGGTVNFDAPFGITGPLQLSSGSWFQNSDATLPGEFTMSSGSLRGSGTVFFDGGVTWTNGSILDSGRKVNRSIFTIDVSGTSLLLRNGCRFENEGTVVCQGGSATSGGDLYMDQGSTFLNAPGALFHIQTVRELRSGSGTRGVFTNQGELRAEGGGTNVIDWDVVNRGVVNLLDGELDLRQGFTQDDPAGSVFLLGGSLRKSNTLTLAAGVLTGQGSVFSNLTNSGATIRPGANLGELVVSGNFVQAAGGTLEMEIAGDVASGNFDTLAIGGTATLGGTFRLVTGGFAAPIGEKYDLVAYASRVGSSTFDTVEGVTSQNGIDYAAMYEADRFSLTAGAAAIPVAAAIQAIKPIVSPGQTSFAEWHAAAFAPDHLDDATICGELADPDFDGICNLLEYAFGGEPLVPSPRSILPQAQVDEIDGKRYLCLSYYRRKNSDLAYVVEGSPNLKDWEAAEVEEMFVAELMPPSPNFERVTTRRALSLDEAPGGFLRVRVEVVPDERLVLSIALDPETGQLDLSWLSRETREYALETSVDALGWSPLEGHQAISGTGGVIHRLVPRNDESVRLFRLVEQP